MALADSLLSAIVRADGDALVMHVGERPYVVVGANTLHISTSNLNLEAMTRMLSQLLPADGLVALEEFGAVEHHLPDIGDDRFNVVAARGGDDIWIEIRRRRPKPVAAEPPAPPIAAPEPPAVAAEAPAVEEPAPVEMPLPAFARELPDELRLGEPARRSELPDELRRAEPAQRSELLDELRPVGPAEAPAHAAPVAPEAPVEPFKPVEPAEVLEPAALSRPEPAEAPAHTAPVAPEAPVEPVEPVEPAEVLEPAALSQPEPAEAPAHAAPAAPDAPVEPVVPAVVLPMTRTVRIEVPPPSRGSAMGRATEVERLLRIAAARGASALFLTAESRPYMRVEGDIRQLDGEAPLTRSDVEAAIVEIAFESGPDPIGQGESVEWLREFAGLGRVRCTTFMDHSGPGVIMRMISTRAATAEQLGLTPEVQALATEPQGLALVAGPRASGKSTLMSALVDLVNCQRAGFVITLERQIRLVHDNKVALISQREIRGGAEEALAAARSALREGPDVLVVDDLISAHMVPLILTAASEGLLVFVSITAPSTHEAVERFIELASPEMRTAVQNAMAESFRGAVAQVLLKKTGGGLIAAREVLLATAPVTRVIGEGQLGQLPHAIENGRKHGMVSFSEALVDFVRAGSVDVREAFRKAPDRDRLIAGLKREGVDTSLVERLA